MLSDNNGNFTVKGNRADGSFMTLSYDPENKLRRIEKSDGTVIAYAYDAKGRRVIRSVDGIEERFHYDGDDVLFDTDGSDDLTVRYVNLPGSVDQKVYATSLGDGQHYTYLRDHLGTIWKVLDSQGNVLKDYVYDSFGQVKGQSGTLPNRYTYTGREIEPETGLYYYRARFYDPEVGRFVGEDPLDFNADSLNFYKYTLNNPIMSNDPTGLSIIRPIPGLGNIWGKAREQDWECSKPVGFLNENCEMKVCCIEHDKCFERYGCNATSWGTIIFPSACSMCNFNAIWCILIALTK